MFHDKSGRQNSAPISLTLLQNKKVTQTTYFLPCLPCLLLVQWMDELDAKLYASAYFMLMILIKVLELCK